MKAYLLFMLLAVALFGCTLVPIATTRTPTTITGPSATAEPPRATLAPVLDVTCTHYAAPGGSDDDLGTEAQPWATFQHAADTAQPGNVGSFRGGSYATDEAHLFRSGTADAPITFIAPLFVSGWSELAVPVPSGVEGSVAEGADVHLQASSPAVDAGSAEGAPADDVVGRPRDAVPDIGACER